MDQLCEPVEVNRRFLKMIEEKIIPEYEKVLAEIFERLKEDIDTDMDMVRERGIGMLNPLKKIP
jgi:hypothetical protein